MDDIKTTHIAFEIFGMVVCVIVAICILVKRKTDKKQTVSLAMLQLVNGLLLLFDALAWAFRGDETFTGYIMVRLSNFMVFLMYYIGLAVFSLFFYKCFGSKEKSKVKYCIIAVLSICSVAVVLLIVSQFTEWFYCFDETNTYHRQPAYFVIMLLAGIAMLILGLTTICARKGISRNNFVSVMIYIVIPIISMIVQFCIYGIAILNLGVTVASLTVFVLFEVEQSRILLEKERNLRRLSNELYAAQIKPHFIFNMLATIKYLYAERPDSADEAMDALSDYFRNYIDTIGSERSIPFCDEIEHIRSYIALEQYRFGDRLKAEYDLKEVGFTVPSLILQAIVENAIRHGIMKRQEGGTVRISSVAVDGGYNIIVSDDGVGFDSRQPPAMDGRKHIGLENVRQRLADFGGTLSVTSEKDKGTSAVIFIPKGEEKRR